MRAARFANVESLDELIGGFIAQRTLQENLAHFGEHEVMVGPMLNADELMQVRQKPRQCWTFAQISGV